MVNVHTKTKKISKIQLNYIFCTDFFYFPPTKGLPHLVEENRWYLHTAEDTFVRVNLETVPKDRHTTSIVKKFIPEYNDATYPIK